MIRQQIFGKLSYFMREKREIRKCSEYLKYKNHFLKLNRDELISCFISTKNKYEHQKRVFSVVLATIIFSGLGGVWSMVYDFLVRLISVTGSGANMIDGETAFYGVVVACILFGIIIVFALAAIGLYLSSMKDVHRELLIIEEVRKEKNS